MEEVWEEGRGEKSLLSYYSVVFFPSSPSLLKLHLVTVADPLRFLLASAATSSFSSSPSFKEALEVPSHTHRHKFHL